MNAKTLSTRLRTLAVLGGVLTLPFGCSSDDGKPDCEGDKCDNGELPSDPQYDRYRGYTENVGGYLGYMPSNNPKECPLDNEGRAKDCLAQPYRAGLRFENGEEVRGMNEAERRGLAAWHLYAADGKFLRQITRDSHGEVNALRLLHNDGHLDEDERIGVAEEDRFANFGVFGDPGCEKATEEDQFGLRLDKCRDPYSSGILGLRLMPNPLFNEDEWNAIGGKDGHFGDIEKKFTLTRNGEKEKVFGWEVEPPYLPSLACTVCHAAANPLQPPTNPNRPKWDELVYLTGNQYFREGSFLGFGFPDKSFNKALLESQAPGTSDTSRVATDHIFNPNTINGVANLLGRRVFYEEATPGTYNPDRIPCELTDDPNRPRNIHQLLGALLTNDPRTGGDGTAPGDGQCVPTSRILKMGGDSSGPTGAVLRVFVNTGTCSDYFLDALGGEFLIGETPQTAISRQDLHDKCEEYQRLEGSVIDLFKYFAFVKPYKLADAEGANRCGDDRNEPCFVTQDDSVLARGAQVFAENCATCHVGAQPEDVGVDVPAFDESDPSTWFTPERTAYFKNLIEADGYDSLVAGDFLKNDFLADDRRFPMNLIGTNNARMRATNASARGVWAEYSSETYKNLPPVRDTYRMVIPEIDLPGPINVPRLDLDFTFTPSGGGRGYIRTPSLVNLWTSAPFLHNNSLGDYDGTNEAFTVARRVELYEDAMDKLLNPEKRLGEAMIRTTDRLGLRVPTPFGFGLPLPGSNVSIDLVGNTMVLLGRGSGGSDFSFKDLLNPFKFFRALKDNDNLGPNAKDYIAATDTLLDRGHEFGADLSDADKAALTEYMKLF